MKKSCLGIFAICILVFSTSAMAQNIVNNGGFETGNFSGWFLTGNTGYTGVGGNAHSGSYAAYMGPIGSDGHLSQVLATNGTSSYTLDFWLANDGGNPNDFSVQWDGITISGSVLNDAPGSPYTEYTFSGLSSTGSDTLQFSFRQDPRYWHLDDVSVVAETPEPASLALLGSGMLGLGGIVRRKLIAR